MDSSAREAASLGSVLAFRNQYDSVLQQSFSGTTALLDTAAGNASVKAAGKASGNASVRAFDIRLECQIVFTTSNS